MNIHNAILYENHEVTRSHNGLVVVTPSHFLTFQINTQVFCLNVSQNGRRWPFWMTENHFRSHFSPFQINTQLLFLIFFV